MESRSIAAIPRLATAERAPERIAEAVAATLTPEAAALTVLFCDPRLDRDALADALRARCGTAPLIACTTAGEIGPAGFSRGGVTGFALPREAFRAAIEVIPDVASFSARTAAALVERLDAAIRQQGAAARQESSFALILIDGLSRREEAVAAHLHGALGGIPLCGGSAGDGTRFASTAVYADGAFRSGCAAVALVETDREFRVFQAQHVVPSAVKLVVTAADAALRTVRELNGAVALAEYAKAIGIAPGAVDAQVFANHPLVVQVGGSVYVRAIQQANSDGSLTFFCAIDEGLALALARVEDLPGSIRSTLAELSAAIGPPELLITCDCILRRLETERSQLADEVGRLLASHNAVGFSTYGEQIDGVHVSQTLTGVAIGARQRVAGAR